MGRLIWTTLISVGVLWIAQKIGWIGLGSEIPILTTNAIWNNFLWLGIIAVIFTVVSYICGKFYLLLSTVTCGFALFLFPVYIIALGFIQLLVTTYVIAGFSYTHVWWQVLILSLCVGIGAISGNTKTNTQTSES